MDPIYDHWSWNIYIYSFGALLVYCFHWSTLLLLLLVNTRLNLKFLLQRIMNYFRKKSGPVGCWSQDDGWHAAFPIYSLFALYLRTSCQLLRFISAWSCLISWDLQRHMLSVFVEALSTTARLRLSALLDPQYTTEDREACFYRNCWVVCVI